MKKTMAAATLVIAVACAPRPRHERYEVVYIERQPPAPRVEVVTAHPGRGFAWVTGFWRYEHGAYMWTPGHWERGPRANSVWVQGSWRRDNRGWYWTPGHWR